MRRPFRIAPLLLLGACAYYNGLYNAERLVKSAERAERDGRTGEASNYWGEAAVKAETVLVRHPKSKWVDRARFIDGKALLRGGNCNSAVEPLRRVATEAKDAALADEAAVLWSECLVQLGNPEAAGFAIERLVGSPDPRLRSEASWRAGVAYRRTGRADEAVALLKGSEHPQARGELVVALADAGRISEALALADTLLAAGDTVAPWGAIVAAIGREDVIDASAMLDRLATLLHPTPDTAAVWLTADALRWIPIDTGRAVARWGDAYAVAPSREAGVDALLAILRFRLAYTTDPAFLDTVASATQDIEPGAGAARTRALAFAEVATSARRRLDSLDLAVPQGDMRGFLLAEALRDSLHARLIAGGVWERIVAERPYAVKALFALAALRPAQHDSLLAVIATRYPADPYLIAANGGDAPAYRVLEDSLARFARSTRAPARPPTRPGRATTPASATPLP